jgi:hypothetical protein
MSSSPGYSTKYNSKNYRAILPRAPVSAPIIPADVQRATVTAPCLNCGTRLRCRHRPWIE